MSFNLYDCQRMSFLKSVLSLQMIRFEDYNDDDGGDVPSIADELETLAANISSQQRWEQEIDTKGNRKIIINNYSDANKQNINKNKWKKNLQNELQLTRTNGINIKCICFRNRIGIEDVCVLTVWALNSENTTFFFFHLYYFYVFHIRMSCFCRNIFQLLFLFSSRLDHQRSFIQDINYNLMSHKMNAGNFVFRRFSMEKRKNLHIVFIRDAKGTKNETMKNKWS